MDNCHTFFKNIFYSCRFAKAFANSGSTHGDENMSIEIPEDARKKYFERRKTDLQKCTEAITTLDYKFLQKVGHDLKGNAVTFGFEPLASIGENLETVAIEQNLDKVKTNIAKMNSYLSTVTISGSGFLS